MELRQFAAEMASGRPAGGSQGIKLVTPQERGVASWGVCVSPQA